jgi:pyruvate kinase
MEGKTAIGSGSNYSSRIDLRDILGPTDVSKRKTKIICTLGPSCSSKETLIEMLEAGMDVARLNFSHGDHESHGKMLDTLREAVKSIPGKQCAVLLDTKGPEIRTGLLEGHGKVSFEAGQDLEITTDYTIEGTKERISCSYKSLPKTVKQGDEILIADGSLVCVVQECLESSVRVKVKNKATIGEKKNMNLPGCVIDLPTLTEKDEEDLIEFGIKKGVDIIAASFIRSAADVENIRDVLGPRGSHIKIVSKIENQEGLNNYDDILEESDGIMVARGDLGMEIPSEKVFLAQKWMIDKANLHGKPVVTATQMLESMINNPRPTRAEASDVANAVLDGSDCVMLSGETAGGSYPVESVTIMAKIACEAELMFDYEKLYNDIKAFSPSPSLTAESIAAACASAALSLHIDLIIVLTDTGRIARLVAKYRPKQVILACSVSAHVVRQMNLSRGARGFKVPSFQGTDSLLQVVIKAAKDLNLCQSGHKVITIHGTQEESPDESNVMEIMDIE